jgi:hypothetical protein
MPAPPPSWRQLPATLTLPEAARVLRMRVARVREMTRDGRLPLVPYTGPGTGCRAMVATELLRRWVREERSVRPALRVVETERKAG